MKIAILNDTHCGVRNDMVEMSEYQGRFYTEVFFPYLDELRRGLLIEHSISSIKLSFSSVYKQIQMGRILSQGRSEF